MVVRLGLPRAIAGNNGFLVAGVLSARASSTRSTVTRTRCVPVPVDAPADADVPASASVARAPVCSNRVDGGRAEGARVWGTSPSDSSATSCRWVPRGHRRVVDFIADAVRGGFGRVPWDNVRSARANARYGRSCCRGPAVAVPFG